MYETAMLKPFRLKTTNGDKLAYYGNCNINFVGKPFENIKDRNKTGTPFNILNSYNYTMLTKTVKFETTTHILTLNNNYFLPNVVDYVEIGSTNSSFNTGPVQLIPNLNVPEVFNAFNDFIKSIKNLQLKKTLTSLFYNITHGNTPYSNVDYQSTAATNTFLYCSNDPEVVFARLNDSYPSSKNNYPQNAILLITQKFDNNGLESPFFFYQKNALCKIITWKGPWYCMPSYGIAIDTIGTVNFYWTTYKGV